jgi:hypothetical protein
MLELRDYQVDSMPNVRRWDKHGDEVAALADGAAP